MARTVPVLVTENPGVVINGALWNAGPKAVNDFYTAPPIFRAICATAITMASGTLYAFQMDSVFIDSDSGHSANSTKYFPQVAGWYYVQGYFASVPAGAQSRTDCYIAKNSVIVSGSSQSINKNASDYVGVVASVLVQCVIGDYVEVWGQQNTGGNLNSGTASDAVPSMSVIWVHS